MGGNIEDRSKGKEKIIKMPDDIESVSSVGGSKIRSIVKPKMITNFKTNNKKNSINMPSANGTRGASTCSAMANSNVADALIKGKLFNAMFSSDERSSKQ
jgi:hypothetical protein